MIRSRWRIYCASIIHHYHPIPATKLYGSVHMLYGRHQINQHARPTTIGTRQNKAYTANFMLIDAKYWAFMWTISVHSVVD